MTIRISELEAIERAMTAGEWWISDDDSICSGNTSEDCKHIGDGTDSVTDDVGIVAMRNAFPVLLAIAKAALEWKLNGEQALLSAVMSAVDEESEDAESARKRVISKLEHAKRLRDELAGVEP